MTYCRLSLNALLSLGAIAAVCFAADSEQPAKMTKMVTRMTSEVAKNDPAAGRSKTLYRAGKNIRVSRRSAMPIMACIDSS